WSGAVGGFENGRAAVVIDVAARSDSNAADLRRESIGNVIAIQVEGGDHIVFARTGQDLLKEGVGDHILDDDSVRELAPGASIDFLRPKLLFGQSVTPVAEGAFGELHNVALVDEGHAFATAIDGILD